MKRLFVVLTFNLLLLTSKLAAQTWVTIPDAAFATYLHNTVPAAMQGDSLNISSTLVTTSTQTLNVSSLSISNLSGIQYFTSLTYLNCNNNKLSSLPALPNTLTYLDCSYNHSLYSIQALSNSLQTLWCQYDSLSTLPALPNALQTIFCFNNYLSTLPVLPASLQTLYCYNNVLTTLPALNNSLTQLYCYNNALTSFPVLNTALNYIDCHSNNITSFPSLNNNSLAYLYCNTNSLTTLPALPNSLTNLNCSYNQLTGLPALPNALTYLDCSYNQITTLPSLPTLTELYCDSNNINCFPVFPNTIYKPYYSMCIRQWIYYINISSNPFTCLPNYIAAMGPDTVNYTRCIAGNANGCAVAGIEQVTGINSQVAVYPNPAKESLTLALYKGEGTSTFQITNMLGNVVKQSIIYNLTSIINVADLSAGVYTLSISDKEGMINQRIVIER
jgi:Leucine-rich repeat (LRR) protein